MRVLHTLGQAGCKTGTILQHGGRCGMLIVFAIQYSNFLSCFFADLHYLFGPGEIRI